jgi:hypothetical protein
MILVMPKAEAKSELLFYKPGFEPKLMLSCSFKCDQIHSSHSYELGNTLLWSLSPTSMFDKPASNYFTP